MKEEFKVISKFIDEKSRVLDVGCGDGILMEYLLKNKVVAVSYTHLRAHETP